MADRASDRPKLEDLSRRLKTPGLPPQSALARGAEVDQPLVSRAMRDELVRFTPRVARLSDYVDMRIRGLAPMRGVSDKGVKPSRRLPGGRAVQRALETCKRYLNDGCDPVVLVDQVGILRRAQRRPQGRPAKDAPR
jgi:hypothetical protein